MDDMEVIPAEVVSQQTFSSLQFLEAALTAAKAGEIDLPRTLQDDIYKVLTSTKTKRPQERQTEEIISDLFKECDFRYIEALQYSPQMNVWFRHKNSDAPFKPFKENKALALITALLERKEYGISAQKAKGIYDTLKIKAMPHLEVVPSNIIKVSNQYYWDTEKARLVQDSYMNDVQPSTHCFRELFDSSGQSEISVDINKIRFEPWAINIIRRYLEANNGLFTSATPTPQELAPLPEDFSCEADYESLRDFASAALPNEVAQALAPFYTWANQDLDTMNDLLKVFTTPFLRTPPKWFVYYIGDTRNGKSSCIKCQRILLGLNNTSGFAMPALFDPHNAYHVLTTMLNAADEDYDFAPKDMQQGLANFKKAATHDEIELPNFYSQSSTTLTPKFLSIFSRNSLPDFGDGDGAQAVNKRMRAIFFRNDLSKFDNNGHDFEKETYTPAYYSSLLPLLFAEAQYYNDTFFEMSKTCQQNSGAVESVTDPAGYFFNELCYWFDYAFKTEFVIDQAKLFFKENGIKYTGETLTAISRKLTQCEKVRLRPYLGATAKRPTCAYLPNKEHRKRIKVLAPDAKLKIYDGRDFDAWRRAENQKLQGMDAQQAFEYEVPSIFRLLREREDDMLDPVAMEKAFIEEQDQLWD